MLQTSRCNGTFFCIASPILPFPVIFPSLFTAATRHFLRRATPLCISTLRCSVTWLVANHQNRGKKQRTVFVFSVSRHSQSWDEGQKEGKFAGEPEIKKPNTTGERPAQTTKSRKSLHKVGEGASTAKGEGLDYKRTEKSS